MRASKTSSRDVKWWGYMILAVGAVTIALVVIDQTLYSHAPDMTVFTAGMSMLLTGVVAVSIANALRNLDVRLRRLEGSEK